MNVEELERLVAGLRAEGSDLADVEVKRASGGFPENMAPTWSALGNTPGAGLVVFGLDEADDFAAKGVFDVAGCKKAIAASVRNSVDPPLAVESTSFVFEGADVVVAMVTELQASAKPCRAVSTGKAYLRFYDGDYALSEVEEQAFIANRVEPRFDQQPVPGATRADLDPDLTEPYVRACTAASSALRRFDREEVLFHTGVLVGDGRVPSLAGLLALGVYPQRFYPNLVIQAAVAPLPGDPPGTRSRDAQRFDGPIPTMLEDAASWVRLNTRTRIRFGDDGHGRDEPEYPTDAVRELLSNALVHRDLGPYALGQAATLTLERNQLVLSNPGGLYGLSVDRLGLIGVTSARNSYLLRICQNVRAGSGDRVVEAIATGIPTVLRTVRAAGMLPPRFHDQGIRFAVRMPNHALLGEDDLRWLTLVSPRSALGDTHRHVLVGMRHGQAWTNRTVREAFPMDSRDATRLLTDLVDAGLAEARGDRGGREYVLAHGVDPASGMRVMFDVSPISRFSSVPAVVAVLRDGPATREKLQERTGLSARRVQYALSKLRVENRVVLDGTAGSRRSTYRLVEEE